jgi:hypothetical protein
MQENSRKVTSNKSNILCLGKRKDTIISIAKKRRELSGESAENRGFVIM